MFPLIKICRAYRATVWNITKYVLNVFHIIQARADGENYVRRQPYAYAPPVHKRNTEAYNAVLFICNKV